jgi:type II pantothenate kinase
MVLGIDLGGSAIKLAMIENGELIYRAYIANSRQSAGEIIGDIVRRHGFAPERVSLTGVGAAVLETEKMGLDCPIYRVLEADAMVAGARFLTGEEEFLTVSIGTGTAFVMAKDGKATHIGGSAFGGGALQGLSRKILGGGVREKLGPLCARGNLANVDLLMSELPSCPPTLDPNMTAANLAKTGEDTTDADWALGILNAVVETVGSMAQLAASGRGINTIIFTGGPTSIPETGKILDAFNSAYPQHFVVPENSDCATAIGAACLWTDDDKQ